ncbi:MAG: hypothetical protein ACT4PM_14370 [Gemmatimonadales bacterium]
MAHPPVQSGPAASASVPLTAPLLLRADRVFTALAAAVLGVFGLLPLANWIPGGHQAPWYGVVAVDLLTGLGISVGAGIVAAILLRRFRLQSDPPITRMTPIDPGFGWVVGFAVLSSLLSILVARMVFSGKPLLIDEIIQVFQARILASGRLWIPAEPHQFFFSSLHLVEQEGRVYSQFPVGGAAMLALGRLVRAEWLVNPVLGGLSVLGFGMLARRIEPRAGTALLATALFALAPFGVIMAGSHMNHVATLGWLLVGMLGLTRAAGLTRSGPGEPRFRDGLLTGLGFGLAATIRPADAAAFALPAAAWLAWRTVRQPRRNLAPLLGAGLGVALPLLVLGWVNLETTGSPWRFGYAVLWGESHDLGFHPAPWGPVHTPARGVELINLYFLRLQTYLFEAGLPSLLPALAGLGLTRKLAPFDRYLLAAGALLAGLYFAYWHDGFYLGPRFLFPLLPLLALWTARLPAALRDWARAGKPKHGSAGYDEAPAAWRGLVYRAALAALVVGMALGLVTALPVRLSQYRSGLVSLRWDADRTAARAGVRNALVLVRESWGAELVARMWALGIPRPDADALYRGIDACRLETSLLALETASVRGAAAVRALRPLMRDSARLLGAEAATGDPSLRLTPGTQYPQVCLAKIQANRSGFTLFPPLLLARAQGNIYVRDLGPRDSLLLRDYPGRPAYLLKPGSGVVGAEPRFHRLDSDSLMSAWRAGR